LQKVITLEHPLNEAKVKHSLTTIFSRRGVCGNISTKRQTVLNHLWFIEDKIYFLKKHHQQSLLNKYAYE